MLIAFKLKLALACAAGLAGPLAVAPLLSESVPPVTALHGEQAIVELRSGTVSYRVAGDFTRAGKPAEAPLVSLRFERPLAIMKHQVSAGDYQRCVDDAACRPLATGVAVAADRPAVQVSWHDAAAYAGWLSRKTGGHYRLPTDEEWAFAAGSNYRDDGLPVDDNDPSKRWIARYERESERAMPTTRCARSAVSAPTRTACSTRRATSGNGPLPALCAPRSITRGSRCRGIRIAASASPKAPIAPMSRTSSATPAPAAARSACRQAISASGWYASGIPGSRTFRRFFASRGRPLRPDASCISDHASVPKIDAAQDDAGRSAFELPCKKLASGTLFDPIAQPHELRFALVGR